MVHRQWFGFGHVEVGVEAPVRAGQCQRLRVDQPAPGGVDDGRPVPQQADPPGVEQVPGLRQVGGVDGDDVGGGAQLVEVDQPHSEGRGVLRRDVRVGEQDAEAGVGGEQPGDDAAADA